MGRGGEVSEEAVCAVKIPQIDIASKERFTYDAAATAGKASNCAPAARQERRTAPADWLFNLWT